MRACLLAMLIVAVPARTPARAQASSPPANGPRCESIADRRIDVGTVPRRPRATVALGPSGGLVVSASSDEAVVVVPFTADGTLGTSRSVPMPFTSTLLAPLVVGERFVIRTQAVCPAPNRYFHTCIAFRALDASGAPLADAFVEDTIESTGEAAIVIGTRIAMVRTPMYDADGTPTVTMLALDASGAIRRESASAPIAGPMPDAHVVLTSDGSRWHALVASPVSGESVRVEPGQAPIAVPGLAPILDRSVAAYVEGSDLVVLTRDAHGNALAHRIGATRPARITHGAAAGAPPGGHPVDLGLRAGHLSARAIAPTSAEALRIDVPGARSFVASRAGERTAVLLAYARPVGFGLRLLRCR